MTLTISELEAVLLVAETLNFRMAAERVPISQPALSRRVQAAEQKLGAKLKDASVTIRAKISEAESLYGSVNAAQILSALKELGFTTLEETMIGLKEHIKTLGTYDVPVKVHTDVTATVKVWVVAE